MRSKTIKIMLVDDEEDYIFSLKTMFEKKFDNQYKVITAKNGMECLEKLRNNEIPDIILLDIMMPGMDGWQVFDILKGTPVWKEIPVIFLTARTDGFAEEAGEVIADDYIKKPVQIGELKERIDTVLMRYEK